MLKKYLLESNLTSNNQQIIKLKIELKRFKIIVKINEVN